VKLTIEPTADFFVTDEGYPVRAWRGTTDRGTRVIAFISAICSDDGDQSELERELQAIPGPNVAMVDVR
jgi:hypothetical protein